MEVLPVLVPLQHRSKERGGRQRPPFLEEVDMDRAEKVKRINRATGDPKARASLMEMIAEAQEPVAAPVEAPKKVAKKKASKKVRG